MKKNPTNEAAITGCFSGGASDLVFSSFRYCLGRRTTVVDCFAKSLAKAWPLLTKQVRHLIKKELNYAFTEDDKLRACSTLRPVFYPLGGDCDRAAWQLVKNVYDAEPKSKPPI